jgi:hypothetical protein
MSEPELNFLVNVARMEAKSERLQVYGDNAYEGIIKQQFTSG